MLKILVTGAGGDVGQGTIRSILDIEMPIEIYATCISKYSPWLHHPNVKSFIAPLSSSVDYIPFLIKLINYYSIDLLITTIDSEIVLISKNKEYLEDKTNCIVFVDNYNSVSICHDKYYTNKFLKSNNFPYLKTFLMSEIKQDEVESLFEFPLITKKRTGRGSNDILIAKNIDIIKNLFGNSSYIIQEYIDQSNIEYTAGIYIGDDKKFTKTCIFKRTLKGGSTYIAKRVIDKAIEAQLISIAHKMNMKYLNIQFFYINSNVMPFEFNGRLSGTIYMISKVFNIIELFIKERFTKENINLKQNDEIFIAMRYYNEIYAKPSQIDELLNRTDQFLT